VCQKPILDRILRATGKPYHPKCFCCVVCGKSLDGIPFTVDATNRVHCIEDFHKIFAPRCWVCKQPIMPEIGEEETVRVVALDHSFHIQCYKCEVSLRLASVTITSKCRCRIAGWCCRRRPRAGDATRWTDTFSARVATRRECRL
jgi:hypothetical protein